MTDPMFRPGAGLWTSTLLFLSLGLSTGGCATERRAPASEPDPYLRGVIQSMDHRATASGILVLPPAGSDDTCGIRATADAETVVETRVGAELRPAAISDLRVGDDVEVHVDGPIAESCPVQGRAGRIVRIAPDSL